MRRTASAPARRASPRYILARRDRVWHPILRSRFQRRNCLAIASAKLAFARFASGVLVPRFGMRHTNVRGWIVVDDDRCAQLVLLGLGNECFLDGCGKAQYLGLGRSWDDC